MPRVALPGGLWCDEPSSEGLLRRELALRALNAEDEIWLLERAGDARASERANALIARCLVDEPDPRATAGALTVGDREAVLLQLRRCTVGERLDALLHCPIETCGERMELDIAVDELLAAPYPAVRRKHSLGMHIDDADYDIAFRLPVAADLDAVAAVSRREPKSGAAALLRACVSQVRRDGEAIAVESLEADVRSAIAAEMARLDPQAELDLDLACPACGAAFSVVFDTAAFFLQELDERAARLLHEVHALAWHYHWSEAEILHLPSARRGFYLERVAEAAARAEAR